MKSDAFTLQAPVFGHPLKPATRSQKWHRLALLRQEKMRLRYGNGPDGQTCHGCTHLVHVSPGAKSFLKCNLAGVSRSEATDWRAKWAACGAFTIREV